MLLLAVQVQLVAAVEDVKIFASRVKYCNPVLSLDAGEASSCQEYADLTKNDFTVMFSGDVTNFDAEDIEIVARAENSDDLLPAGALVITDFQVLSPKRYTFKISSTLFSVPTPSLVRVLLAFRIPENVVPESNRESNIFAIEYVSDFQETYNAEMEEETVLMTLSAPRTQYEAIPNPMTVTINGEVAATEMVTYSYDSMHLQWITRNVNQAGSKVCLTFANQTAPAAYGDVYGMFFGPFLAPMGDALCITTPADPCDIYKWSEWTDCTYQCTPIPADESDNVQRREKTFSSGCNQIPEVESRLCPVTFNFECVGFILGGETGSECSGPDGCTSGLQLSGCYCGSDCEDDPGKICCQSFYTSCVEDKYEIAPDASTDGVLRPEYRYEYFPCWNPTECVPTDPANTPNRVTVPACDNPFATEVDETGDCEGRRYNYYCACGPDSKCAVLGGVDACCNSYSQDSGVDYASICLGQQTNIV